MVPPQVPHYSIDPPCPYLQYFGLGVMDLLLEKPETTRVPSIAMTTSLLVHGQGFSNTVERLDLEGQVVDQASFAEDQFAGEPPLGGFSEFFWRLRVSAMHVWKVKFSLRTSHDSVAFGVHSATSFDHWRLNRSLQPAVQPAVFYTTVRLFYTSLALSVAHL